MVHFLFPITQIYSIHGLVALIVDMLTYIQDANSLVNMAQFVFELSYGNNGC